ncbi:MAG TPA: phosphoribosylpyrophosphate synthetase [Saprospiraceae bacterium]|nr:phosphoribosylpyrophosphate synthetase [Saprospiraceae bacterium]HMP22814.1 phosphoribosylpyrophosphate synthetase [Saprospiraceae bacterium]
MHTYDTLIQALTDLRERGYTEDFNLLENCVACKSRQATFDPDHFNVVEVYRFEGMNNPADSSVLYVIETDDGLRGTLLDAYGAYAGAISPAMIAKLNIVGH